MPQSNAYSITTAKGTLEGPRVPRKMGLRGWRQCDGAKSQALTPQPFDWETVWSGCHLRGPGGLRKLKKRCWAWVEMFLVSSSEFAMGDPVAVIRVIYMYYYIRPEFALNEAHLQMRSLFVWKRQHIRSHQDNEALMCCLPWKMKIYAPPNSRSLGAVSGPWIMRAKDHCLKISNLSSQKIPKDLCNTFLKHRQTIESTGKANQPLLSGWKQISAFRTLAAVVGIGIYCSKFPFFLKDFVLTNPVEPIFLPCEGRIPRRYPSDSIKSGSSKSKPWGFRHTFSPDLSFLFCSASFFLHSSLKSSSYIIKCQIFIWQSVVTP